MVAAADLPEVAEVAEVAEAGNVPVKPGFQKAGDGACGKAYKTLSPDAQFQNSVVLKINRSWVKLPAEQS